MLWAFEHLSDSFAALISRKEQTDLMRQWIHKNLITVIALFAYVVMAAMLVAQTQVIDNQRALIKLLYSDSLELNARKVHDIQMKHAK